MDFQREISYKVTANKTTTEEFIQQSQQSVQPREVNRSIKTLQLDLQTLGSSQGKHEKETNDNSAHSPPIHQKIISEEETDNTADKSNVGLCKPKTNIVFIKTIKTGGSTLTNILSRYAMKNNLTVHGHEGYLYPSLSHGMCPVEKICNVLNMSQLGWSNIISEHFVYNRNILSNIMPTDVVYVTQLRHPLMQLVSWLNYRGHSSVVDLLESYKSLNRDIKFGLWNSWRQMCIPENINKKEFNSYLTQLTEEFDLVTITEHFDFSLLLLRRKLCWDISDMLYIPMKRADYAQNQNAHLINIISNNTINKKYEALNPLAYALYRHFNNTLSDVIVNSGPDLQEEFALFQKLKQRLFNYCSRYISYIVNDSTSFLDHTSFTDVLDIPTSKWGKAHTIDPIECAMMKLHKKTFQQMSVFRKFPKLDQGVFVQHARKLRKKKIREMYLSFDQPIHPRYGIPLRVLTHAQAYDLNEHVVTHGQQIQEKDMKKELHKHRVNVRNIDKCVAENHGSRRIKGR